MAKRSRSPLKRRVGNRYEGDKVLIVCEGTDTEPNYFTALKEYLKLNPLSISIHPAKGYFSPQTVVDYAILEIEKACDTGDPYTKVYCIIDRDKHPTYNEAFAKVAQYKSPRKCFTQLCLIPSVPCFEYWILMHIKYTTRSFGIAGSRPCDELINSELKGYSKNDQLWIKQLIETKLETAKINSRRSHTAHKRDGTDSFTTVYLLVEELEYLKKKSVFETINKGCPGI